MSDTRFSIFYFLVIIMADNSTLSLSEAKGLRTARELETHLSALHAFTPAALGILAVASGVYTYLGVSSLLDDAGAITFFAAIAYSIAVSVGIFVFWSYLMRLLPSMRNAAGYMGLTIATIAGSAAIIAMSSWLNAAALAGSAAVEQHLSFTVQDYQKALERAYEIANTNQDLLAQVGNARENVENLKESETVGSLSGASGRGTVFFALKQKADELSALEEQIVKQSKGIAPAFERGSDTLSRMRQLTVERGSVEGRSIQFAEESVRLAVVITELRQLSVAPLVKRAAENLPSSVFLTGLDGRSKEIRASQKSAIEAVKVELEKHSLSLLALSSRVLSLTPPKDTTYTAISKADAVIRYASSFFPSWAGAIAIDLLPGVLVFILAVTQATIRRGRDGLSVEETLTLADLRAAMNAMKDVEASMGVADAAIASRLESISKKEVAQNGEEATQTDTKRK